MQQAELNLYTGVLILKCINFIGCNNNGHIHPELTGLFIQANTTAESKEVKTVGFWFLPKKVILNCKLHWCLV